MLRWVHPTMENPEAPMSLLMLVIQSLANDPEVKVESQSQELQLESKIEALTKAMSKVAEANLASTAEDQEATQDITSGDPDRGNTDTSDVEAMMETAEPVFDEEAITAVDGLRKALNR